MTNKYTGNPTYLHCEINYCHNLQSDKLGDECFAGKQCRFTSHGLLHVHVWQPRSSRLYPLRSQPHEHLTWGQIAAAEFQEQQF